jgi:hypothetical protein
MLLPASFRWKPKYAVLSRVHRALFLWTGAPSHRRSLAAGTVNDSSDREKNR